jgi:hypothetical protein
MSDTSPKDQAARFVAIVASMLLVSGCDRRRMSETPMPIGQPRLQLQCDEQSPVLQCHALAFDEPTADPGGRDVTDTVHWTSSDEQSGPYNAVVSARTTARPS